MSGRAIHRQINTVKTISPKDKCLRATVFTEANCPREMLSFAALAINFR
jgi:hypothetical protein